MKTWRKIDYGNCLVLSGHNRNAVDRYKEEYGNEHEVEISLFRSKSNLNQIEKSNAEEWKCQRRMERDEKEAKRYFEDNKSRFKEMGYQASVEYLKNQNLSPGVWRKVEIKVANLLQK